MTLDTAYRNVGRAAFCVLSLLCTALSGCNVGGADAATQAANALAFLEANRISEARQAITAAIANRDAEPEFHLIRGRIEVAVEDWESAYNAYSDAVALDSSNMEALQGVSQLGLRTGHLQQSREATQTILLLSPDQPQALVTMGLHSLLGDRLNEAEEYANRALAIDPASEGGAILKSRIAFGRGNAETARAVLDRYQELRGETEAVAIIRLEMARATRDAPAMDEQFRALRRMDYDDSRLQLDEADFAFKTGRSSDGLALTTALLIQSELSRAAISAVINIWREYGIAKLTRASVHAISESGSSAARLAAARYLAERGELEQARSLIAGLSGWDKSALAGRLVALSGDRKAASRALSHVLENDTGNCIALAAIAELEERQGEYYAALRAAQKAATECPDDTAAWILAANAYSRLGDDVNATRMFRQGIEANPQSSDLAREFADWLHERENGREAVVLVRKLTRDAPALLSAWRLYGDTCRRTNHPCVDAAEKGLADARTRYGMDPLPGERRTDALFGRFRLQ